MISEPGSDLNSSDQIEHTDTVGSLDWRPINFINQDANLSHQGFGGGYGDINNVDIQNISLGGPPTN